MLTRKLLDDEREEIRNYYEANTDGLNLTPLAEKLGRTRQYICRVAKKMDLTSQRRSRDPEMVKRVAEKLTGASRQNAGTEHLINRVKSGDHPRGMAGKPQTEKTKSAVSKAAREMWADPDHRINSAEYRQMLSDRASKNKSLLHGENVYSRAKSGRREDLGFYVRSAWEANYARYLNFLQAKGEIRRHEYEPDTFYFEDIKRGTRSYTPDFKVWITEERYEYHEVKGWMDQKSSTKLKRMEKYYPGEKVIVIGKEEYNAIKKWSTLIPGWE